ncbi:hypothetical protein [Halorientalis halophila]|uniref:hypothetical protein n=1 Tax=Halorientalis halophila TaxID=3108499 RepID=UPI003008CBF2
MVSRRQLLVAGLVALTGAYLLVGGLGGLSEERAERDQVDRNRLILPTENGSYLWPYTSRKRTTAGQTLAINLVIHGDDQRVHRALTEQTSLDWRAPIEENETAENGTDSLDNDSEDGEFGGDADSTAPTESPSEFADDETPTVQNDTETPANGTVNGTATPGPGPGEAIRDSLFEWADAHGSTRYTYIDSSPKGGSGHWLDETYQIHAGTYLGSRHHIRAYAAPRDNWTAIQVHQEYWDWFRLRHTVTDSRNARNRLENDFIGQPYVSDVTRTYYGVHGGWNDGWLSEIDLRPASVALVGLLGLLSANARRTIRRDAAYALRWIRGNVRGLVLAAMIAALYLSVRSAGLFLESLSSVDPRAFVAVLYPVIAIGLPVVAFVFAQPFGATSRFERLQQISRFLGPRIQATPAFVFAFIALCVAFVLDFGGLGITSLPIELAIHRVGLAVALGLIAAGATRIDERGGSLLAVGVLGWLVGLAMPLLGYL